MTLNTIYSVDLLKIIVLGLFTAKTYHMFKSLCVWNLHRVEHPNLITKDMLMSMGLNL